MNSSTAALPLSTLVGQTVTTNYTTTSTPYSAGVAGTPVVASYQDSWTLLQFENITLAGHAFADVCKFEIVIGGDAPDRVNTVWYAQGFGMIKYMRQKASDRTVLESAALSAITAQP